MMWILCSSLSLPFTAIYKWSHGAQTNHQQVAIKTVVTDQLSSKLSVVKLRSSSLISLSCNTTYRHCCIFLPRPYRAIWKHLIQCVEWNVCLLSPGLPPQCYPGGLDEIPKAIRRAFRSFSIFASMFLIFKNAASRALKFMRHSTLWHPATEPVTQTHSSRRDICSVYLFSKSPTMVLPAQWWRKRCRFAVRFDEKCDTKTDLRSAGAVSYKIAAVNYHYGWTIITQKDWTC